MNFSHESRSITVEAPAKINLFLDVLSKRDDGYHEIATVMQSTGLCDRMIVSASRSEEFSVSVECTHPDFPRDGKDTVSAAARAFAELCPFPLNIRVELEKRIPVRAGLGGGSADAAGTLFALSAITGYPLDRKHLFAAARSVGADVPFCLAGGLRVCRGAGEIMSDTLPVPGLFALIAKPTRGIPTGGAFAELDRLFGNFADARPDRLPDFVRSLEKTEAGRLPELYNVFESVLPRLCPESESLLSAIRETTASAALSGSGSAVFGLYETEEAAREALRLIEECHPGCFTAVAPLCGSGPVPVNYCAEK